MAGILRVGTSGFAYPGWSPRFYPEGIRPAALLKYYASMLSACELNNTYYQQPTAAKVDAWLASSPQSFRFAVKAQRGGSYRSLLVDPVTSVPWLTDPLRRFGDRLGTVLFRVPDGTVRSDERLAAFLAAWPQDLPLTIGGGLRISFGAPTAIRRRLAPFSTMRWAAARTARFVAGS